MRKIKKAIIPVAGLGTRFLPITKSIPKEMLPIVDRPIIDYIVEEALLSGITEILFIISENKEVIKNYYEKNEVLEERLTQNNRQDLLEKIKLPNVKISYIYQKEALGSGHAIKLAKEFAGGEDIAILFGDNIIDHDVPALKQLINVYEETQDSVIGVTKVPLEDTNRYGIVAYKNDQTNEIKEIIEKPEPSKSPSTNAVFGRYVMTNSLFEALEKVPKIGGEYGLTDAFPIMMQKEILRACQIEGNCYDTGNKAEYIKANLDYSLKHEETKNFIQEYIKEL